MGDNGRQKEGQGGDHLVLNCEPDVHLQLDEAELVQAPRQVATAIGGQEQCGSGQGHVGGVELPLYAVEHVAGVGLAQRHFHSA